MAKEMKLSGRQKAGTGKHENNQSPISNNQTITNYQIPNNLF